MNDNPYKTAGILSLAAAAVYPTAWAIEIVQEAALEEGWFERTPIVGFSDFLFLVFAGMSVYVLLRLKHLLYDRFALGEIGVYLLASVAWHAIYFGGSFVLELLLVTIWPEPDLGPPIVLGIFFVLGLVIFGLIDLFIGIKLLRSNVELPTPAIVVAWLSIIIGFFELTVIFSFVTLPMVPILYIALAILFIQRPRQVEFV